MALSSTDPRVLMGQAECFSCLSPHQLLVLRTYLFALIGMADTSATGVQALSSASTCFSCLTYEELIAAKNYLMAVWLGLDTSLVGVEAQVNKAACDLSCLTPKQQEQLETYLLSITVGSGTDAAGVRAAEAAAKCFGCLGTKRQMEAQVYLMTTIAPGAPTTPATVIAAAKCFRACVLPGIQQALQASFASQAAGRSTPPCVTPTAPSQPTVVTATTNLIKIAWTQPANSGSLITSYTISWGTATGVYTNSATVNAGIKSYTIAGLTAGTQYFFAVKGNSFAGCSSANSTEQNTTTAGSSLDPAVTGWAARVVTNGGPAPTNATKQAIDTFWKGVKSDGMDGLIIALNFVAPDSIIAAKTPFIVGPGNDPWQDSINAFTGADLSVNGLLGNIALGHKLLNTGVSCAAFTSDGDCGLTFYVSVNGGSSTNMCCGVGRVAGNSCGVFYDFTGFGFFFEVWAQGGACPDRPQNAAFAAGFQGYCSNNRISLSSATVYKANSVTPHAVVADCSGGGNITTTRPAGNISFVSDTVSDGSNSSRYSFFAIHHGFTSAQSALFFARVQALRVALGGGFV